MAISAVVVAAVLVATVFAFRGAFGKFPDSWEWVGVVMAGVGLVMGSHPLFQAIWGRPDVQTKLEVFAQGAGRSLVMYIRNEPIKRKVYKKLGVKRETVDSLTVQYRIAELGSGKILIPVRQARIYSDADSTDLGRNRITLPPTYSVAANVMIVSWDLNQSVAIVPPNRLHEPFQLAPGLYVAHIILLVDGEPTQVQRQFTVGDKADDLSWASI